MSLAEWVAALIVVGLTAYAVLGGADFGTGFWELSAGRRRTQVHKLVERSMGPVWEANHVWLIFVLVVAWTGFPRAFGAVSSTLAIPLFLAAIGIILRGAAFATRGVGEASRARAAYAVLFGVASLATPFFLGVAIGAIASGRIPVGNAQGDLVASWWNPTGVLAGALAVVTGAYLAAVYLAADANRRDTVELTEWFRRRALVSGVVAGGLALVGLLVVRSDAPELYDGLTGDAWWLVLISGLAGAATIGFVWIRRYGLARLGGAVAVAALLWGWAVAQAPDVLPGHLALEDAAASRPVLVTLLAVVVGGALVLVPSLGYLFRLALAGTLDKDPVPGSGRPLP